MNNNVIPNFLPPAYDFTTEEEEEEEEADVEEKHDKEILVLSLLYGIVLGFAFYRLMNSEINVDFKLSVNKREKK